MKTRNTYMTRVVRELSYKEDGGILWQLLHVKAEETIGDDLVCILNPLDHYAFTVGDIVTLGVSGYRYDDVLPEMIIIDKTEGDCSIMDDKEDTYMNRIITKVECSSTIDNKLWWTLFFDDDKGDTARVEYVGNDRSFQVGDMLTLGLRLYELSESLASVCII